MNQPDTRFPTRLLVVIGGLVLLGLGCAAFDPCAGNGPPCQTQYLNVDFQGYIGVDSEDSGVEPPTLRLAVVNPSGQTNTHEANAAWVEGEGYAVTSSITSTWRVGGEEACPGEDTFTLRFDLIGAGWSDTGEQDFPTIEATGDEVEVELWEGLSATLWWYGPIC